jgi:integrase
VATFLNWAIKNGLIESHPFKNAVIKTKTTCDAERPALSDEEIKNILENLPADQESLSWCILISCFSDLRQSEVAGLDGDGIVQTADGIWCLDINDRGDKKLKSKNGQRIVPLHRVLLQVGIVQFAQSRASEKLFHDIQPYKGKYGHQVSKDFAKYRKSLGINGAGQTFHGIRHSVISKLWASGIPEAHTAAIAGHQRGKSESYLRYSKKNDLGPLREAIDAIDYGDIKLPPWLFRKWSSRFAG